MFTTINSFTLRCCILTILMGLTLSSPAWAQKNNKKNDRRDEQRENERFQRAQRELNEAQKELREKQSDLKTTARKLDAAEDKLVGVKRDLREAEDAAEAEIGKSLGIPEAIAQVTEGRKHYDTLAKPVLDALRARPEWKTVEAEAAKAKAEKEALRENVEIEDDQREQKLKELVAIIQLPLTIEDRALAANAECMAAKKLLDEALMKLAELRKSISPSKLEAHPKVQAAKKVRDEAQKSVGQLEKSLAADRNAATKAQRSVVAAQNELNRAKQADANDSNKGKKK